MTGKPIAVPSAGHVPAEFEEAHRALLADSSIQFELEPYEPPQTPGWVEWLGRFLSTEHPVLNGLLWVAVALIVLTLLFFVVRRLAGSRWPWARETEETTDDWRPGEAPARALLAEADALAAEGRFGEAAHLLLFRSIEDIDSRRPDLVRPALTSRDIAALPAIPERPRGAFARIAMMVERSLFARRPLAAADWRDCRAAYEEFAFAEGWRG